MTIECDEAWSCVDNKNNKQWIWLAIDKKTREIVGVYICERGEKGARELWNSLPPVYRQCAICYTDFWVMKNYTKRIPLLNKTFALTNKSCDEVREKSLKKSSLHRINLGLLP